MPRRGLFGVAPYVPPRREGSVYFRGAQPVAALPRPQFLTTPERQRPFADGSTIFRSAVLLPEQTSLNIRRFIETSPPYTPLRSVAVNVIRGVAGASLSAPPPPPPPEPP